MSSSIRNSSYIMNKTYFKITAWGGFFGLRYLVIIFSAARPGPAGPSSFWDFNISRTIRTSILKSKPKYALICWLKCILSAVIHIIKIIICTIYIYENKSTPNPFEFHLNEPNVYRLNERNFYSKYIKTLLDLNCFSFISLKRLVIERKRW